MEKDAKQNEEMEKSIKNIKRTLIVFGGSIVIVSVVLAVLAPMVISNGTTSPFKHKEKYTDMHDLMNQTATTTVQEEAPEPEIPPQVM